MVFLRECHFFIFGKFMYHYYFGKLNVNHACLYRNDDHEFSISMFYLYFDKNNPRKLKIDTLDKLAWYCQNIENLDKQARQAILNYLKKDNRFIEEKSQEINQTMTAEKIANTLIMMNFVMLLARHGDEHFLTLNYLFDKEDCYPEFEVRFNLDGTLNFVKCYLLDY